MMKPYLDTADRLDFYRPHAGSSFDPAFLARIKVEVRGQIGDWTVWAIDGNVLRSKDVEFTTGGNPARYLYVPPKELWVEQFLVPDDAAAVNVHEAVETILMMAGMKYELAHDESNKHEWQIRQAVAQGRLVIRDHAEGCQFADHYVCAFVHQGATLSPPPGSSER